VAYQSLYRKYRPQRFSELVGQEHVTTALRNAVRDGRVGHAYLFSGPRGTGKTTTARVIAKALNCTNLGDDGEPCGACESCVGIAEGRSLDVFEQDAASRNLKEDMQDLLRGVATSAASGHRKVYILDEVHMLGPGAVASLLKTLEEPPEHVVFVLATTNPERVLPTIKSRTQHFEFTLLTSDEIIGRLASICAQEGVEADEESLAVIATAAAGSARDAESLLDQATASVVSRSRRSSRSSGPRRSRSAFASWRRSRAKTRPRRSSPSRSSARRVTILVASRRSCSRRHAMRSC
jgi:DNA polymerase-3 subunit gamma/tau